MGDEVRGFRGMGDGHLYELSAADKGERAKVIIISALQPRWAA